MKGSVSHVLGLGSLAPAEAQLEEARGQLADALKLPACNDALAQSLLEFRNYALVAALDFVALVAAVLPVGLAHVQPDQRQHVENGLPVGIEPVFRDEGDFNGASSQPEMPSARR